MGILIACRGLRWSPRQDRLLHRHKLGNYSEPRRLPKRARGTLGQSRRREGMRRVVVSGLGVVAPNGVGRKAFWSACLEGKSGVGPIRTFDASGHPVKIA